MYNSMWLHGLFFNAWPILFLEHNHKDRLSEAYEKQKELEQKLQAMQQNYKKRLRKKEDSCIHPSLDMIQARDERLQDVKKSYWCSTFC